ncbi:MAG: undecaprenyldiphospho-muramoylpentapeptide beta-N-acetylglucosaminyltransferase [Pirellulales bacterium]|nr:undecaprenyldiphospho-muramoylpentapeptide beta-N-acetylglucosaminyltransferase [Pirellulales bacterium]
MTHSPSYHIVFAGGGTGGHLFPGLAVAEQLEKGLDNLRVTFTGTGKALERREVAAAGWNYLAMPCRPAPQRVLQCAPFFFRNLQGYITAGRFLRKENVTAVVGLGGYASVPTALAAVHRKIPLVLLEQNVTPGRATRWLAEKADRICTSFAATEQYLPPGCRIRLTGNPLRAGFENTLGKDTRNPRPVLLVLGGSGGARTLNEQVPPALAELRGHLAGWRIVHQTGRTDDGSTRARYARFGLPAATVPFLDDLPQVLAETELAISRAGGTALAEFAAAGVAAVLIPYPHARDQHQLRNAEFFAKAGAALLLPEQSPTTNFAGALAESIQPLLDDALIRNRMVQAMLRLARPEAAAMVAEQIQAAVHRSLKPQIRRAA